MVKPRAHINYVMYIVPNRGTRIPQEVSTCITTLHILLIHSSCYLFLYVFVSVISCNLIRWKGVYLGDMFSVQGTHLSIVNVVDVMCTHTHKNENNLHEGSKHTTKNVYAIPRSASLRSSYLTFAERSHT